MTYIATPKGRIVWDIESDLCRERAAQKLAMAKTYGETPNLNKMYGKYATQTKIHRSELVIQGDGRSVDMVKYCQADVNLQTALYHRAFSNYLSYKPWEELFVRPVDDTRTWALVIKFFRECRS
jgi:hypothetical protein